MKKICYGLSLVLVIMLMGCSSDDKGGAYAKLTSNTECLETRGVGEPGYHLLKLTHEGKYISAELQNILVPCDNSGIAVDCQQDAKKLNICVYEDNTYSGIRSTCTCPVNIYFTINETEGDVFDISLICGWWANPLDLASVSFKEHKTAIIDCLTHEVTYSD